MYRINMPKKNTKIEKYMKYTLLAGVFFSGMMLTTACTRDVDSVDKTKMVITQDGATEVAQDSKIDDNVAITEEETLRDDSSYTAQDYEKIIATLKETEPVDVECEHIIQTISRLTVADYAGDNANTQLTYRDLEKELPNRFYSIIDTACFDKLYPEFNEKRITERGTMQFSKDEVRMLLRDFYKYEGDLNWDAPWIIQGEDDKVEFMMASGEMKNYITKYMICENEDYYLLSGACFSELMDEWRYYVDVLLEKNDNSTLGMSFSYLKTYDEEKKIASIEASSSLEASTNATYEPKNLLDGDFSTAWVEGEAGVGTGTTITIKLAQPTLVYGLKIFNGYQKSKDIFVKNGRVKRVTVSNADNVLVDTDMYYEEPYTLDADFGEYDRPYNMISFEQPAVVDEIVITIQDACAGDKYEDTAISELLIY